MLRCSVRSSRSPGWSFKSCVARASFAARASPGLKWKAKPRQLASGTESRVTTEWKTSSRGTRNVDTGRWATFSARTAKPRLSTDASLTRATTAESSGATPARSRAAGPGGLDRRHRLPGPHLDARLAGQGVRDGLQAALHGEAARVLLAPGPAGLEEHRRREGVGALGRYRRQHGPEDVPVVLPPYHGRVVRVDGLAL